MSRLRPGLVPDKSRQFAPDYPDSLYMIRDAVRTQKGLIHGRLDDKHGAHCAIGSFFDRNPKVSLQTCIIDEVATYNDSIPPRVSAAVRRRKVLAWLNFKLCALVGGKL